MTAIDIKQGLWKNCTLVSIPNLSESSNEKKLFYCQFFEIRKFLLFFLIWKPNCMRVYFLSFRNLISHFDILLLICLILFYLFFNFQAQSFVLNFNNFKKVWVQLCGALIIVSLGCCLIGVALICWAFSHKKRQERKLRLYGATMFVYFVGGWLIAIIFLYWCSWSTQKLRKLSIKKVKSNHLSTPHFKSRQVLVKFLDRLTSWQYFFGHPQGSIILNMFARELSD